MRKINWTVLCLVFLVSGAIFVRAESVESIPEGPPRYVVEDLQGRGTFIPYGGSARDLKEGMEVGPGDEVRLEKDAQAVLMLNEETTLLLSPSSDLQVAVLEPQGTAGFLSKLRLLSGRLLSQVQKLTATRSKFEVEAGGLVCGVRGTAFEVEILGEDVEARTHEGEVAVENGRQTQSVKAGHVLTFRKGLLRQHRRLDRSEMDRFSRWKAFRSTLREKRSKRLAGPPRPHRAEKRPLRKHR